MEGLAGVPTQGTVTVAGFQNDQEVVDASFTFSPPDGELAVPMMQAILPEGFKQLQNVTLIQNNPALVVLICDDFNVTTHT